jgi:hypothetical protein
VAGIAHGDALEAVLDGGLDEDEDDEDEDAV